MGSVKELTYISLFSGGGIGCYGMKKEDFKCIATVELLDKRMKFQRFNKVCDYDSGYIAGDIRRNENIEMLYMQLDKWKKERGVTDVDVIMATPPCQGMSVANHKKGDEKKRNSLVVESIKLTKNILPKYFIFENVKSFYKTLCTDVDGEDKKIKEAIELNLGGAYNILYETLNFKDYGNNSSRTRALTLGVRKDLKNITPYSILPDREPEKILKETIGGLKSLSIMGQIDPNDVLHAFRPYKSEMIDWIKDLNEGQSAFDNKDINNMPHTIIDGKIIVNVNKNGDKYKRWFWNRTGPCIHTRNDIFASQNTIHPSDNRVFSVRELMIMMTIPNDFKWFEKSYEEINAMNEEDKTTILRKDEMNIRHTIGEAVPTIVFQKIAQKIKNIDKTRIYSDKFIQKEIEQFELFEHSNLYDYCSRNIGELDQAAMSRVIEMSNTKREEHAAYYTRQDTIYSIIKDIPDFKNRSSINVLEPSVGAGSFIYQLFDKFNEVNEVVLDLMDVDSDAISMLKKIIKRRKIPKNFKVNFICGDFLTYSFDKKYDLIIGNPPFKKIKSEIIKSRNYKQDLYNDETNNLCSFFLEKALKNSNITAFVLPKSVLNAPEFNKTRDLLRDHYDVYKITDFGENAFSGVLIETISLIVYMKNRKKTMRSVRIESFINKSVKDISKEYIFDKKYPYWLIYRDGYFDNIAKRLEFNIFKVFRDRQITKKQTRKKGKYRVLKSRNISNNKILNIDGYDTFVDDLSGLAISKYLNNTNAVLVPNLTYNPRACFLPKNTIADGSVAVLTLKNGFRKILKSDLKYFATDEFNRFYKIARNFNTRSMNIDSNSVFYFGAKAEADNDK